VVPLLAFTPAAWVRALLTAPLVSAKAAWAGIQHGVRFVAEHTGIPVVVVAAVAAVLAFRAARRSGRFFVEVAVVLMVLVVATRLGLIAW
jgi:hypothetical protein